jgi:hypothetical protein
VVKILFALILTTIVVHPFHAKSDVNIEKNNTDHPIPTTIAEPGKPYELRWPDGRVAQFYYSDYRPLNVPGKATVFLNSCSTKIGAECAYKYGMLYSLFQLRWTVHPQLDKVGKVVQMKTNSPQGMFEDFGGELFESLGNREAGHPVLSKIPMDRLSCKNWSWYGENPKRLLIENFSSEFMFPNPETGNNENTTAASVENVVFEKEDETDELVLRSYGEYIASEGLGGGSFFNGDTITWRLKRSDALYCDVSLKPDFTDVQNYLSGVKEEALKSMVPFIHTESSVLKRVFFIINSNLITLDFKDGNGKGYEFQ